MVLPALMGAAPPAGGAATNEVIGATAAAGALSVILAWLVLGHRSGRRQELSRAARWCARRLDLPYWAALPLALSTPSLLVALLGMYWDISLHIDNGRDPGPLANPAHYLILGGLWGIFSAGVLAVALPRGRRPGAAAVHLGEDFDAPVGGVLMAACAAFALLGFPLDDVWHRLFGQDVTLWGPTHLMLFGGAGLSLIGQAVLLAEAARERPPGEHRRSVAWSHLRPVSLMGGMLIGLSTIQGEFDFGVPQYRAIFHPLLIALAAGLVLVAARLWIGRGGALGAALFFLVVRGIVSLIVGEVFGQTIPALPLYVPEALLVELAGLWLAARPLALGAAGGALAGTVGFAAEWGWTHLIFRLPWERDLLPEGLIVAIVGGVAGGVLGALLSCGLRGRLPEPRVARALAVTAVLAVAACVADGLVTTQPPARATMVMLPGRNVDVRIAPAALADTAEWVTVTAWQGGGLHVDRLTRLGPGHYRTNSPVPMGGKWKSLVRVHRGRAVLGAPVELPPDAAIPVKGVPAPRTPQVRPFVRDQLILQRERKRDVPTWLWSAACIVVACLGLTLITALSWGVGRVGRRAGERRAGAPIVAAAGWPR
ncbi:MAG TPA: hypothetical protein VH418_11145 [Solirubrobacteraceae bacterium]